MMKITMKCSPSLPYCLLRCEFPAALQGSTGWGCSHKLSPSAMGTRLDLLVTKLEEINPDPWKGGLWIVTPQSHCKRSQRHRDSFKSFTKVFITVLFIW